MDSQKKNLIRSALGNERVKFDEDLSYHTHNKLEVVAGCFYIATSQNELIDALNIAHQLKVKFMILGSGSRIFFQDKKFDGLVIKNRSSSIKISGVKGKVGRAGLGIEEAMVEADSGVSIGKLNGFLKEQKLIGLMGSSPIFCSLGGSIFLDPFLKEICVSIKVWERGEVIEKDILEIKRKRDTVLSLIIKVKAERR